MSHASTSLWDVIFIEIHLRGFILLGLKLSTMVHSQVENSPHSPQLNESNHKDSHRPQVNLSLNSEYLLKELLSTAHSIITQERQKDIKREENLPSYIGIL